RLLARHAHDEERPAHLVLGLDRTREQGPQAFECLVAKLSGERERGLDRFPEPGAHAIAALARGRDADDADGLVAHLLGGRLDRDLELVLAALDAQTDRLVGRSV